MRSIWRAILAAILAALVLAFFGGWPNSVTISGLWLIVYHIQSCIRETSSILLLSLYISLLGSSQATCFGSWGKLPAGVDLSSEGLCSLALLLGHKVNAGLRLVGIWKFVSNSWFWNSIWAPVCVEYYKIIALWRITTQAIVLCAKSYQLRTRPVIPQFLRPNIFMLEHLFKQCFPLPTPLGRLMHIKVEHAKWLHFFHLSIIINKQLPLSHLKKPDNLFTLSPHIKPIVGRKQFASSSDNLRQFLCFCRSRTHFVYDVIKLIICRCDRCIHAWMRSEVRAVAVYIIKCSHVVWGSLIFSSILAIDYCKAFCVTLKYFCCYKGEFHLLFKKLIF